MRPLKLRERIRGSWWGLILAEHDTEPTEFSGGLLKVLLGLWFLAPTSTFDSSPSFDALRVLPEWVWGCILLLAGFYHLASLRIGTRTARRAASLVGFLIWVAFATTFWLVNPATIGVVVFYMVGAGQGWCYVRLGGGE